MWGGKAAENIYIALYFKAPTPFPLIGFPSSQGICKPTSSAAQAAAVPAAPDERALPSTDLFIFPHVATIKRFLFRLRSLSTKVSNCLKVKTPVYTGF